MKLGITAVVLAALMCGASVASIGVRSKAPDVPLGIQLETAVPERFGDWVALSGRPAVVTNPQTEALLKSIYSQILTRTYVHRDGSRIMLSLAYGETSAADCRRTARRSAIRRKASRSPARRTVPCRPSTGRSRSAA